MASRKPRHHGTSPGAVVAVERALADTDHTRLPAALVARIAVETATPSLEAEFTVRVVAPLHAEVERLRAELRRLQDRPGLRLVT